jgi:hypothetical protein
VNFFLGLNRQERVDSEADVVSRFTWPGQESVRSSDDNNENVLTLSTLRRRAMIK